jgi:hypothetical protein
MNGKTLITGCFLSTALVVAGPTWAADDLPTYEVTVTNITPGQPIAPFMVATHKAGMSFFEAGAAPAPELADLAEAGNGVPMAEKLRGTYGVSAAEVAAGGIGPGGSMTVKIMGNPGDHLSLGAMLGNTNDAFAGLEDVGLPKGRRVITYMAPAYDAGTETNDELCATVPGPACKGEALSPDDEGEGIVTIHNGIHGIGGLMANELDWRNPVAKVVIKRVH